MNEKVKVESQAFLFWDSYNEGTYDVGRTKAKRERYLEKKLAMASYTSLLVILILSDTGFRLGY